MLTLTLTCLLCSHIQNIKYRTVYCLKREDIFYHFNCVFRLMISRLFRKVMGRDNISKKYHLIKLKPQAKLLNQIDFKITKFSPSVDNLASISPQTPFVPNKQNVY